MKKVLFITYGGGHVNIVLPIVKRMMDSGEFRPVVIGLTTAANKLEENGIPFNRFADLLNDEDKARALEIGTILAKEHHNASSGLQVIDTIHYLGTSVYDLSLEYGLDEGLRIFRENGRKAFLPLRITSKILEQVQPDLVVTTCGERAERAMTRSAKAAGIPSLRIVDLFGTTGNLPDSDYIAVMNSYAKSCLIQRGVDEEKIFVTGQPAFEALSLLELEQQSVRKSQNPVPQVLWASQNIPEIKEVAEEVFRTFDSLPDVHLLVKLHPNENGCIQEELLRKYSSPNIRILRDGDMKRLIQSSDVVITQFSTCGLEAILLGKPLITINFSGKADIMPYASSGAATGIYEPGRLISVLKETMNSGQNRTVAPKEQFLMPKGPTDNVLQLIKNIVQS